MGKRSDFQRRERDFYPTPYVAVKPLMVHLRAGMTFDEPCAGDGALIGHLERGYRCSCATDISPRADRVWCMNAMNRTSCNADVFITNPPWPQRGGEPTVSIALHLSSIAPTWLLLSSDFAHNAYFTKSGLADRCVKIVSVGRVSWMENGVAGKDNCAWYLFDAKHEGATEFFGRAA